MATDDSGFVTQLYLNVLNHTPDANEVKAWRHLVHAGDTNGNQSQHGARGFADNTENIAKVAHAGQSKSDPRAQRADRTGRHTRVGTH
jgi:hypothetical protein